MLARRLARNETGSISAPARNVSTPLPSIARKFVQSSFCRIMLAAGEVKVAREDADQDFDERHGNADANGIKLAANANPIQMAATNQIFSCINKLHQCGL